MSAKFYFSADVVGVAYRSGTTRLKLWALRTPNNTTSNILSDRFTHSFKRVEPVGNCTNHPHPITSGTLRDRIYLNRQNQIKLSLSKLDSNR